MWRSACLPVYSETMMQGYVELDEATKVLPLMPSSLRLGAAISSETAQLERLVPILDLTEGRVMLGLRGVHGDGPCERGGLGF